MPKLFSIVGKNMKVVSRSWIYVALLIILPTMLVIFSSFLLDSVNMENVKIGLVENENSYQVRSLMTDTIFSSYNSFEECDSSLKSHNIPICINPRKEYNTTVIDIWFDNSKLLVSQYAKQYVSKKVLEEQLVIFELTLGDINSNIDLIYENVESGQKELESAYNELLEQQNRISAFKQNFSHLEGNFNNVYSEVKNVQPLVEKNIRTLNDVKSLLGNNLSEFQRQSQDLRNQINIIKPFLKSSLSDVDYNETSEKLDSLLDFTDVLDRDLSELNSRLYYENPDMMLQDFNNAVATLDETKTMIGELDSEVNRGMELIDKNRNRAQEILNEIDENRNRIDDMRSKLLSASDYKVVLNDAFDIRSTVSYLFFPLLFVLIISFTSIILSNMFIIEQTHKPAYTRDMITPTFDMTFLIGDFIVCLLIVLFQVMILFLVGQFMFSLSIFGDFAYLLFVAILVSSIFVLLGMSFGYFIRSRHVSVLVSTFVLLFSIVFSDLFIPRQLTGIFVRLITALNPFVVAHDLLFDRMIFSQQNNYSGLYIALLIFYLLAAFLFAYVCKKVGKYKIKRE